MNTATIVIAIYGAILSSIVFIWNVYRDLTNKGRLDVHCYIGKIIQPNGSVDDTRYLVYHVTNTGKKPVIVTHIGGSTKKHLNFMVNCATLPKSLAPGEYLKEFTPDLSALNDDLISLHAISSLGKVYKVKKRVVKHLIRKAKEICEAKE